MKLACVLKVVYSVSAEIKTGGLPSFDQIRSNTVTPESDELHARGLTEVDDVFGCPVFPISIESVNDRFPRMDRHDPFKHFGFIDLNNEAIE